jgi:hypothetical protein
MVVVGITLVVGRMVVVGITLVVGRTVVVVAGAQSLWQLRHEDGWGGIELLIISQSPL